MTNPDPLPDVLADVLNSHRFALYDLVPQGKAISTEFALIPLPKAGLAYTAVSIASADGVSIVLPSALCTRT